MIDPKLKYRQWITLIVFTVLLIITCAWSMTSPTA